MCSQSYDVRHLELHELEAEHGDAGVNDKLWERERGARRQFITL